jgi:hypothetical protein
MFTRRLDSCCAWSSASTGDLLPTDSEYPSKTAQHVTGENVVRGSYVFERSTFSLLTVDTPHLLGNTQWEETKEEILKT